MIRMGLGERRQPEPDASNTDHNDNIIVIDGKSGYCRPRQSRRVVYMLGNTRGERLHNP